jgi:mandelate racemase
MAVWDACGKQADLPLYRLLGGESREINVYNFNGLGLIGPKAIATQAKELSRGFGAVKLRLGYPDVETDIQAVEAAIGAVPDGMPLMCDYNQCLSRADTKVRLSEIDDLGLTWIEEPINHDDVEGYAGLCASRSTPIQLGENARNPAEIQRLIATEAAGFLMPDVAKIGGITPWMNAAEQCAASRCLPTCSLKSACT